MTAEYVLWERTFVASVKRNGDLGLPVWDPVKERDTIVKFNGSGLEIFVEGEGWFPIEVEYAVKNHITWLSKDNLGLAFR